MKRVVVPLAVLPALLSSSCNKPVEIAGLLDVPGALFEYTAEGSGIPCVVFTGSENIGRGLYTDELREHILFIHAAPSNLDPEHLAGLTLADVTRDIERVRTTIGADQIAVMGHSMFGPVPLEYALDYPEHTWGSILTGAMPSVTTGSLAASAEYWETNASEERKAIRAANHEALAARDPSAVAPSDLFWDQYEADVPFRFFDPRFDLTAFRRQLTTSVNVDFINYFWDVLMHEFDHTAAYSRIRTPVLVIAGVYDFGMPHFLWEDVVRTIPDFTFQLFEEAGHNPMLEDPPGFDRVVIEWLDRVSNKQERP